MHKLDLAGQRFNQLFVLEEDIVRTKKEHQSYWICQCDCGNIVSILGTKIKSGHTKSCGCLQKKRAIETHRIDLSGQKFHHLTVIEPDKNINGQILWKCKCDCGNEVSVRAGDIKNGHTKSCGCIKTYAEEKVAQILQEQKIKVIPQKRFSDLKSDKNGFLSYDFYLPDFNILIECQGKQHYEPIDLYGGIAQFEKQQKNDKKKAEYALSHNIALILIPYWDYEKINQEYILKKIKQQIN